MAQEISVADHKEIFPFSTQMYFSPTVWLQMLYALENEEQGINIRVFHIFNCVMSVLKCWKSSPWTIYHRNSAGARMAIFKFNYTEQRRGRRQQETTEHWDNIALPGEEFI